MTAAWNRDVARMLSDIADAIAAAQEYNPTVQGYAEAAFDALMPEITRLRAQVEAAEQLAEALRERDGGVHDADCKIMRKRPPMVCTCGHGQARAALAAWAASREGER